MLSTYVGIVGVLSCLVFSSVGCGQTVLHVSPEGDDGALGALQAPLATLEGARDAIRAMKKAGGLPQGGITVQVAQGVYERSRPFELSAEDSGSEDAPIIYRNLPGAKVRIVGGRLVSGFTPVTDEAVSSRLEPAARGNVFQADLEAQGISDYGQLSQRGFGQPMHTAHMELFFEDRPMTLARWPNEGYATIADLPAGKDGGKFSYEGDRPSRWADEPDIWVYGYWYHDWADTYMKVADVDSGSRTITTVNKHGYGLRKGNRWHVLNVLAELDSPGEYYVDRDKGILYFWPPSEVFRGKPMVSIAGQLITMKDTTHVTVRGFTLEACRGTAASISGGVHNSIIGCTIRNTGNKAVSVSGAENAVIGCDIYETGDGGISLSGGVRQTLTPAGLLAQNNHIHHFSRWSHTYRPAVGVHGCGNIVRNNLLHHGSHNAIQLGGNDHVIEFNEIHSVCTDTGDVGAFYMGRDWTARGTVIKHNYWHDIRGPGRIGAMGVYLDDQASGILIYGNIFLNVTRAAFIGGGCDNVVENNIFVDCVPAVHIDARGLGWQKAFTEDTNSSIHRLLHSMPYQNELWSKRFPNLPNILNDDPGTPKRNRVVRNVSVGGQWDNIHGGTRNLQVIEDNLIDEDPQFVDRQGLDFRLKETSPAFALGFKPIPVERIGLYETEERASWPVTHTAIELTAMAPPRTPKPPTGPRPTFTVQRSKTTVTADGHLEPSEWGQMKPEGAMVLKEDFYGEETKRTSLAWLHHDGVHLCLGIANSVLAEPALKTGHQWGRDDAVEIAIRNTAAGDDAPIIVLRGYADGTMQAAQETGASPEVVARAQEGVEYGATVTGPTKWTAECRIPFASLGIDPAKHKSFEFNLSARKTGDDMWLMWRSTRANTWFVDRAGTLKLAD